MEASKGSPAPASGRCSLLGLTLQSKPFKEDFPRMEGFGSQCRLFVLSYSNAVPCLLILEWFLYIYDFVLLRLDIRDREIEEEENRRECAGLLYPPSDLRNTPTFSLCFYNTYSVDAKRPFNTLYLVYEGSCTRPTRHMQSFHLVSR